MESDLYDIETLSRPPHDGDLSRTLTEINNTVKHAMNLHKTCMEEMAKLRDELTEAKACLGYSVPGDFIPKLGLKCGICEATRNREEELRERAEKAENLNRTLFAQVERLITARDAEIVAKEKAEAECAELQKWVAETVENCSVFKAPPSLDCGKGLLDKIQRLREALAPFAACEIESFDRVPDQNAYLWKPQQTTRELPGISIAHIKAAKQVLEKTK